LRCLRRHCCGHEHESAVSRLANVYLKWPLHEKKTHNAYNFQSKKCLPRLPHDCGISGVASPRSLLIRSFMISASACDMKWYFRIALSGKSTMMNHAPIAISCVRRPSMIFVEIRAAPIPRCSQQTHKDPPPATQTTNRIHLYQSVCQNIGESSGENGEEIEKRQSEGHPLPFAT